MTFLALIAIIFFGFAVYNLTCAFVDIPTKKTSQMMMLSRKQQGTKNEKLLDVYVTKIAGWIAPYLRLDRLKRNKVQRALDIAGLQLTPEVYTARAWVTAGAVGLCAIPMAFLIPLLVPILIGLAVALWFSTYYAAFDFVKKRRKLIEGEIPRFALTVGQSLENGQHGAANAGFKSNEGIFIVAGLHISNGLIQLGAEVFPSHTAVGSQNFKYIPVIFKALANGQSKSGNLALNQFAAFFNKIKGCIVG